MVELPPLATVLGAEETTTVGASALTVTVVDCTAWPFGPEQVSMNVELSRRGPTDWAPLTALLPDQAPEATQEVALVLSQVSLLQLSALTVLGSDLMVTEGAASVTVTVMDWTTEPNGPWQAIAKSVVFVSRPVLHRPLVARGPLQPPLAVQLVTLRADQESTDSPS
jgi:hypothetical protein